MTFPVILVSNIYAKIIHRRFACIYCIICIQLNTTLIELLHIKTNRFKLCHVEFQPDFSDHLIVLFTSFCSENKFFWLQIIFVSSAKRYVMFSIRDGRSLMYTANVNTRNTEPCRPPFVIVNSDESESLTNTHSVLFDKKSAKKLEKLVIKSKMHQFNKIAL